MPLLNSLVLRCVSLLLRWISWLPRCISLLHQDIFDVAPIADKNERLAKISEGGRGAAFDVTLEMIAVARRRFAAEPRVSCFVADLRTLSLAGRFDLIAAVERRQWGDYERGPWCRETSPRRIAELTSWSS